MNDCPRSSDLPPALEQYDRIPRSSRRGATRANAATGVDRKGVPEDARPDQVPVMARYRSARGRHHRRRRRRAASTRDAGSSAWTSRTCVSASTPARQLRPGRARRPRRAGRLGSGDLVDDRHLDLPPSTGAERASEPAEQSRCAASRSGCPPGKVRAARSSPTRAARAEPGGPRERSELDHGKCARPVGR